MKTRISFAVLCVVALMFAACYTKKNEPKPAVPTVVAEATPTPAAKKAKAKKAKTTKAKGPKTRDTTTTITETRGEAAALPMDNFKKVFDGDSLNGWIAYPANSWTVKNGALASLGEPRGFLYTKGDYSNYRVIFKVRHLQAPKDSGKKGGDHQANVLVFCERPPSETERGKDALGGVQFQVPNAGHWDYRPGINAGGPDFKQLLKGRFNVAEWSQVEILVNADKGTARMAVAHPVGTKAVEMLDFKSDNIVKKGPFALQIHNGNLFDEYKDIMIEENPASDELITTK